MEKTRTTEEENNKKEDGLYISLEMMQATLIQKEGEATSQIIQAYKGERYDENGVDLHHKGRSLKEISNYKINPDYEEKNIKQQSGFSAELIHEARENKKRIRENNESRIRTTDGLGMTNDTRYDHVEVDRAGEIIEQSGSQMKFYGVSHKNGKDVYLVVEKMVKEESWDRYETINVPKEQYEGARDYAARQSKELRIQADKLKERGEYARALKLEQKADRYEQAVERIRKTNVTTDDAIMARLHPEIAVTQEVIKDAGYAGVEAAAGAAVIAASLSAAQNLYAVACHERDIGEAAAEVAKDTAKAGLVGFGVGAAGTSIKAMMQSSSKELIRRCGNTSLPSVIASSVMEVSKSIKRYASKEIDELQLVEELGEKGVGLLASGYGTAVGSALGGVIGSVIPVFGTAIGVTVGGFVGSLVGYSASSILYYGALSALKAADISEKRRSAIARMANDAIRENQKYIDKLNRYLSHAKEKYQEEIVVLLESMQKCICQNNVDGYVSKIEEFGELLGISLDIKTFEEFETYMENDELAIVL